MDARTALRRSIHGAAMGVGRALVKLVPDRVPVTFVGPDATEHLCRAIARAGGGPVLLVTDADLVRLGLAERIEKALSEAGVEATVYSGVRPDPTFDQVAEGLDALDAAGCRSVLALGGGSPMDAAKVIAAAATNRVPVRKLEGMMKVRRAPLPLYAIPTTAGTGSEVTLAAVVSEADTHQKRFFIDPKLLPRMAALDPGLMTGLPPAVTAATGMDALTHAVESYLSRTANEVTRDWARLSVRLVFEHLPGAYEDGQSLEHREGMALAAYYGGLAFTRTGVGYVHAIAHTLGARYGTPHGLANAIALPPVLEFSKAPARARLAELAELVGAGGGSESERADAFIAAVRALEARVGIPSRLEALRAQDVPGIARQALDEAHLNYPVPRYMSQAECESLLRGLL